MGWRIVTPLVLRTAEFSADHLHDSSPRVIGGLFRRMNAKLGQCFTASENFIRGGKATALLRTEHTPIHRTPPTRSQPHSPHLHGQGVTCV